MALRFDYSEVVNPPFAEEELSRDERDARWQKFEHIVLSCMAVGIGHIKDEDEAREWFNRYRVCEVHSGRDRYLTLDDVKTYIGLNTNVSRESRFKWDARMRKAFNLK